MASGTRLARLKKLEDDSSPKHKTRKLDKLNAMSPLKKKLETTGKNIPESPLRRSVRTERVEPSTKTNTKKHASPAAAKNGKGVGPSSNLKKSNKNTKIKLDLRGISSSTDDSNLSSNAVKGKRKMDVNNINIDPKSENSERKMPKKHLHAGTYKKLIKSTKGGSQDDGDLCLKENSPLQVFMTRIGSNISKGKGGGNKHNLNGDVHDKCAPVTDTSEPLDTEDPKKKEKLASNFETDSPDDDVNTGNGTMLNGSKNKKRTYDILLQSPGKKEFQPNHCAASIDSSLSFVEELGVSVGGVPHGACSEKNHNVDPNGCAIHSQTTPDLIPSTCLICDQPGQLMCCSGKGCQRSYHLSCLGPLLPGAWLCKFCVKKKMEEGVYSVSEGIESVWDVDEGVESGKHYYVKYKGFSHAHNRWIPESQLLHDAPSLLAKFRKTGQKDKVIKWRKKWAEPERLLLKRLVVLPEVSEDYTSESATESSNSCNEWFVKWKGLEYDQATWELEESTVLNSSEVARLMQDYEYRREQARMYSDPQRAEKAQHVKKEPFYKLTSLPDGCHGELGPDHLAFLNSLREFWHKSVNAVLIDDQERFTKSILLVLALQCHASRPFLIITTPGSLPLWQAEFVRLAPSLNVVMYQGDNDARKIIKDLEFYEESGCLLFQVLLAAHDAIIEDFSEIICIGWEAVVIDKCEKPKISRYVEKLKILSTDFNLVLFNGQLKDNPSEYRTLLSLVSTGGTSDDGLAGPKAEIKETPSALTNLKEQLAHHIAYDCKADSSSFQEYWVPVPLSNVQLEQYCATFISNSSVLRSNSKSDVVGALHNILITTRKCCDHPYLVDGELRGLLTKGLQPVDFLNAEVRASGKLFLLDKILQEMKRCELRVVIVFQSLGGPTKISLGDILDDFLQQRFGADSYERIESGLVRTKKLASINMFNNKESGRFAFLIEKRACVPSVKLRFVDSIILFDSDWNPVNDMRSLQKLSIEPQDNCIKVFRLYTTFTVEEKLLMFSKQDTFLDSNVENISRNSTHSLLGWGASYLFRKLDQFHASTRATCISEPSFDKLCLNDVISEILTEMPGKSETTKTGPHSILLRAHVSGSTYKGNIALVGEKEGVPFSDKDIPFFWPELLEGRYPRWIHISDRSQRIRRQVHNFDGFAKRKEMQSDEVKKKRRKISVAVPVTSLECSQEKRDSPEEAYKSAILDTGEEPKLEEQRNLLMLLRPELSKLCDILGLPVSVKNMTQEFLVYIMNNHDVSSKQVTVLQALEISLCWRAASMSRHRLDRVESLVLAREHLNFECTEVEAYSVYSRLRILKEKFPFQAAEADNLISHDSQDNHLSGPTNTEPEREPLSARFKEPTDLETSALAEADLNHRTSTKSLSHAMALEDKFLKNQVDLIEKVSLRRSEGLAHKQQAEVLQFEKQINEERLQLEEAHSFDLDFISSVHIDLTVINGKMNLLTQEFSTKMGRFYQHLKQQKENLLSLQLEMRNKEYELKQSWVLKAYAGQLEESFDKLPLLDTAFKLEKFNEAAISTANCSGYGTAVLNSEHSDEVNAESVKPPTGESIASEECCHDVPTNILNGSSQNIVLPGNTGSETHSDCFVQFTGQTELVNPSIMPSTIDSGLNQEPVIVSVQKLTCSVSESTSPDVQALFTNDNSRNLQMLDCSHEVTTTGIISDVSLPHVALCNDETPSNFTNCQADMTENEPSSLGLYFSGDRTENQAQHPMADLPTNLIPENAEYLQRTQDLLFERESSLDSLYSTQQTLVPGVSAAVMVEPSEQRNSNSAHRCSSQEDPPAVGTSSENPRSANFVVNDLFPNLIRAQWIPPQAVFADPLQNELLRIQNQDVSWYKKHEEKKLQIQLELEIERDKLMRKYESMFQDLERVYSRQQTAYQELYDKVLWHKVFAEEIRSKFYDHKEGAAPSFQGPNQNLSQQLHAPVSRPPFRPPSIPTPVPPLTVASSPHPATLTTNPELSPLLASPRPRTRIPSIPTVHSSVPLSQASPNFTANSIRGSTNRSNSQYGRLPAPHLQRFRPSTTAPLSNPAPASAVSIPSPTRPSSDFTLPLPIYGLSQPITSGPSPPITNPQQLETDRLLESWLLNLPPTNNEFFDSSMIDSRHNEPAAIICLSDDD